MSKVFVVFASLVATSAYGDILKYNCSSSDDSSRASIKVSIDRASLVLTIQSSSTSGIRMPSIEKFSAGSSTYMPLEMNSRPGTLITMLEVDNSTLDAVLNYNHRTYHNCSKVD